MKGLCPMPSTEQVSGVAGVSPVSFLLPPLGFLQPEDDLTYQKITAGNLNA